MDLAVNNLQRLICHKTQQTKSIYNIIPLFKNLKKMNVNIIGYF